MEIDMQAANIILVVGGFLFWPPRGRMGADEKEAEKKVKITKNL